MFAAALLLAASLTAQPLAPNAGYLWSGDVRSFVVMDTSKPFHFSGGGLSVDLLPYPGGFMSLPFIVAGISNPITLEFHPRHEPGRDTWGLEEASHGGRAEVGDYTIRFGPGSTTTSLSGDTDRYGQLMWAMVRAGAMPFTLSQ